MKNKISIGSSAFIFGTYENKPVPLIDLLEQLQTLGFDGIELVGAAPYGAPDDFPTIADRKKLVKMIHDHDLEISNYGGDFGGHSPADNDPEEKIRYLDLFIRNLQFCIDCEIPSIRVDTVNEPPLPHGVSYHDAWNRFTDTWRECAETAAREGVLVAWEFEPGFMFNKPGEVKKMVDNIAHPNFKVMFDTCHAHMCGAVGARQQEPAELLEGGAAEFASLLNGQIGYVHLIDSDNTLHNGWTSTHAPFGTGNINFSEVLSAISAAGYAGEWWTIDLCFWPKAWEILKESKLFVEKLLISHGLNREE